MRIFLIAVLMLFNGCVSFGPSGSSDLEVVERSKEQAPQWISLRPGILHESTSQYKFVEVQSNFPDLPLGIKQAQIGALNHSEKALRQKVKGKIGKVAEKHNLVSARESGELDQVIRQSLTDFHGRYAKIADIYFEKLRNESNQHFFNAHILVQFPSTQLNELFVDVGRKLGQSPDLEIRRLGSLVSEEISREGITH